MPPNRLEADVPPKANHVAHVEAWLDRAAKGLSPPQLLQLFERALGALWRRAEVTLGEVTLRAIGDRVLYVASERYPFVSTVKVEKTGIRFDEFRRAGALDQAQRLPEVTRYVIVEFLTVLGSLTGEILTPALHAELSRVALEEQVGAGDKNEPTPTGSARDRDDDSGRGRS